ncbi:MAG: hypothetical protein A2Y97_01375 [Nitrospirae bacterium RBG_13_39_12]|nr:MAG: hypothetical protein A2Y97_01375 [Nitrospirae bacterium RBG_13_39_12]
MRDLLKDKRFIQLSVVVICFFAIIAFAINLLSSGIKERKQLTEKQKEILVLRDDFLSLKQRIDSVENKKDVSNVQGVIQAVDEIFLSIGLKDKIKTVKSTGKSDIKDVTEEEAELQIEKVSMNEMVNIFYRIKNAPMVLIIKKAAIKKSFESPELLNITLTLSFLKTK